MKLGIGRRLILPILFLLIVGWAVRAELDVDELPTYIMHAGGTTVDGRTGTNSIEALDTSYENGHYWIEVDFNWTSDDSLVCLHDWQSTYSYNLTGVLVPNLELFESLGISTYGYESPTLDTLIKWMQEHPLAMIVTAVKENNQRAVERISKDYSQFIDRFIVQIYNQDECSFVEACGFENIIYTLYRVPMEQRYDIESLRNFVENSEKLDAITVAEDRDNSNRIASLVELGIPIYVHTVNDPEAQAFWRDLGVHGFYCDYVQECFK